MSVVIELDEKLVEKIDFVTKILNVKREDFVDDVLRKALQKAEIEAKERQHKERQHRESYEKFPVQPEEFYIDEEQLIEAWKDL